ncbi:MAG TPA: hypothetical protein VMW16_11210 [Sedimentisphaerales bacterium]|nr:hypothetical protein [Sedimentisphaerales bacterium]
MKEASRIHRVAMELVEKAYLARLRGEAQEAEELLRKASETERAAAAQLAEEYEAEPTRSVLYRSAASLAVECGELREAEKLISMGLAGNPPDEIADELRDLLEKVYFERHLALRGIELRQDEFQFSISGDLVGFGVAHSEEFVERVQKIETLVYRTAERKLQRPFRKSGRRAGELQREVELYVSIPRAASFAVSFRLGSSKQLKLPGMDLCEEVINDILMGLELFNRGEGDRLRKQIGDETYYTNFIVLARSIAPDGKNVRSVGFTGGTRGREKSVVLSTPRSQVLKVEAIAEVEEKREKAEVRGFLRFADARKEDEGLIEVIDENNKEHKIKVPGGMMADIVRPMFAYEVVVSGYRVKQLIMLENIERAAEEPGGRNSD